MSQRTAKLWSKLQMAQFIVLLALAMLLYVLLVMKLLLW
jgi:hypothetical protein